MKTQRIAMSAVIALAVGGSALADGNPLPPGGILLSDILGPGGQGSFKIADKLFSINAFVPTNIFADQVTVVPFVFGPANNQVVGFDLLGEWTDLAGDQNPSGFTLSYDVTVLDPTKGIKSVGLAFNGFAIGDGFTDIDESIFDASTGQLLGNTSVFASGGVPDSEWVFQDNFALDEVLFELNMVKDFFILSGEDGDVSVSVIRQSFAQIPGPGALSLLAVAGLAASRRRR